MRQVSGFEVSCIARVQGAAAKQRRLCETEAATVTPTPTSMAV